MFGGMWITAIIRQSRQRRELIEQLAQTQAELLEAERQAGILSERQRLAHEIHDTLAQGLTSVVMHLEAAEQQLANITDPAQHHLDQARDIARDSLTEARRWVWALQPTHLEQGGLPEAIQRVATRWSEANRIPATITVTGQSRQLHPEMEVTFLRVMQEALANVHKHATARAVAVTLSYMEDLVILDVQDDGVGFQFDQQVTDLLSLAGGYGLKAMSERIAQLGGSLQIESMAGEGTTVVAQIPI
jgi:signal transduction histidine kinase